MTPDLLGMLAQFGTPGLLGIVIIWDRLDRRAAEKERTESDKALAAALSALTVTIQHLEQSQRR